MTAHRLLVKTDLRLALAAGEAPADAKSGAMVGSVLDPLLGQTLGDYVSSAELGHLANLLLDMGYFFRPGESGSSQAYLVS